METKKYFAPSGEGRDYDLFSSSSDEGTGHLLVTRETKRASSVAYRVLGLKTLGKGSFYEAVPIVSDRSSVSLDSQVVLEESLPVRQLTSQEILELIGGVGQEGSVYAALSAQDPGDYFADSVFVDFDGQDPRANVSKLKSPRSPLRTVGKQWFDNAHNAGVFRKT